MEHEKQSEIDELLDKIMDLLVGKNNEVVINTVANCLMNVFHQLELPPILVTHIFKGLISGYVKVRAGGQGGEIVKIGNLGDDQSV